jgi:ADP-ribosyl-[dinitrogen reductase] hydrolase
MEAPREHDPLDATLADRMPPVPESIRNCYWVVGGRLLAGMHPWSESRTSTLERLRELKSLGIDWVADLTAADESAGYSVEYPGLLASFGVEHHRFAMPDHSVPSDRSSVVAALDAIDAALGAGRKVYLHCRAGIGRTGLLIGCWLARHGEAGESAIERLNELWTGSRLAGTWLRVPETEQQARYVRDWRESRPRHAAVVSPAKDRSRAQGLPSASERCFGAILGMAIAESRALDPGARSALAWGGHTAMTVCLAESLLARGANDPEDQMRRYLDWQKYGRPSSTGQPTGVPDDLKRALAHWQWTHKPVAGSHDPARTDPHTLPRSVAVALRYRAVPQTAIEQAAESSRTTLQSPVVLDACRVVAALAVDACGGIERDALVAFEGPAGRWLATLQLKPPIARLVAGDWRSERFARVRGCTTVRSVLAAALRSLAASHSFDHGLEQLLAQCGEPAAAAALYGALAGTMFGTPGLPETALDGLRQRTLLEDVAGRLYQAGRAG